MRWDPFFYGVSFVLGKTAGKPFLVYAPYNRVHVLAVVVVIDILVPSRPPEDSPPTPSATHHRRFPNLEVPPCGRRVSIKIYRRFSSVNSLRR